ncbi:hypothetical protein HDU86_008455 [Geranomyces michiganensis]|nr:hypothetical protein HDU86_008455 [Geranomyces michiganensis]
MLAQVRTTTTTRTAAAAASSSSSSGQPPVALATTSSPTTTDNSNNDDNNQYTFNVSKTDVVAELANLGYARDALPEDMLDAFISEMKEQYRAELSEFLTEEEEEDVEEEDEGSGVEEEDGNHEARMTTATAGHAPRVKWQDDDDLTGLSPAAPAVDPSSSSSATYRMSIIERLAALDLSRVRETVARQHLTKVRPLDGDEYDEASYSENVIPRQGRAWEAAEEEHGQEEAEDSLRQSYYTDEYTRDVENDNDEDAYRENSHENGLPPRAEWARWERDENGALRAIVDRVDDAQKIGKSYQVPNQTRRRRRARDGSFVHPAEWRAAPAYDDHEDADVYANDNRKPDHVYNSNPRRSAPKRASRHRTNYTYADRHTGDNDDSCAYNDEYDEHGSHKNSHSLSATSTPDTTHFARDYRNGPKLYTGSPRVHA